jgi:hypothetical protein
MALKAVDGGAAEEPKQKIRETNSANSVVN